jgi:glycosyltransferase involved in cell wall biosynthesis
MNILYLVFHGFDPNNGISKKISYQTEAMRSLGHHVHICYLEEATTKRRIVDNCVIADYGNGILGKIRKRIEFNSIVKYAIANKIDFVYIRSNHNANLFTINMVKRLKQEKIKIVMEIPTYPYDQEYGNWWFRRQIFQDRIFRNTFAKYCDAIVTFSENDFIFGQRTIKISNGIDFNSIKVKPQLNDTSKELNLIGVAEIHHWHGFDRLVAGLANYYSNEHDYIVNFHVVGYFFSKEDEISFKSFINKHHMDDHVIIYGKKNGEELDLVFDKCDMGVGSLGRHRVDIQNIKTLKNREYAARGIPFVYSETDNDFDGMPYVLKMPADETPIDIEKLVEFYRHMTLTPQEIRDSIRHLSWEHQIRKVFQEIYPSSLQEKKIKIAYCIPLLNRASGMERVLTIKANYLTEKLGYDVAIILTDGKGEPSFFPLSEKVKVIQLDINIDNLWKYPIWKHLFIYKKKIRVYRKRLELCLNYLKPDITISLLRREINFINDLKDGSIKMGEIHFGRYRYREFNKRYFPTFVNKRLSALWMKQLDSKIIKLEKFIVLTHEDSSQWKRMNNITVIPNPITINGSKKTSCTNKQAIAVGRYTLQKGIDLLIEAWKKVNEKHPEWLLNIYGSGDKSAYENMAIKYQLTGSINLHHATKDIIEKYLESSIYVLSSRYEGLPLVLMEAMSVGLPCVAFACPCGPKDIIHDGEDGILCEDGNVDQLAEGICKLIEDEEQRKKMGINAAINIQRFTLDNIMQQWDNLFKETIHNHEKNLLFN